MSKSLVCIFLFFFDLLVPMHILLRGISHGALFVRHYIPAKTLTNLAIHVTITCGDKLHTQRDETHTYVQVLLPLLPQAQSSLSDKETSHGFTNVNAVQLVFL